MPAIGGNTSLSLESPRRPNRHLRRKKRRLRGYDTPFAESAAGTSVAGGVDAAPSATPQPTPATQSGDTLTLIWLPLRHQLQPDGR